MCGICGLVGPEPVDRLVLERMTQAIRHRGPDDEGFLLRAYDDGVALGLGFRRLAIIDLVSGNQPLGNEDGSIQLVFNGEIYNFRELRRELEGRGHVFRTESDAEALVHLYEEDGPPCVERLNGMFAFALWDEPRRRLVLARDRFGKKPLYYAEAAGSLLFGSELKALLEHPLCPRELDHESLSRYLALEYVPTPRSIFTGVRKLPGGHVLVWQNRASTVAPYWDLSFEGGDDLSADDYVDGLRHHLREAVRRRLVSDVPLGAFLSGGIDSSSVVAMMVEAVGGDGVKTFSIAFQEPSFDESAYARQVAAHLGTEHHETVFSTREMLDVLPLVTETLDEPLADPSVLPTYLLSRFARESVTVALGGDGGDELLAGYPTFPAERVARFYPVPESVQRAVVAPLANRLPSSEGNFSFDFKVKRFVRGASAGPESRHALWLGAFSPEEQGRLLERRAGDPYAEQRATFAAAPTTNWLERLVYLYAKTYLQDDILVKVDRASMACALEVRAPFLDVDLVDFLGRVPPELKLHRFDTKHLLKRAMANTLPRGIASRPKKGFGIPVSAWLRTDLKDLVLDELAPDRLRCQGLFQAGEVQRLVSEHMSGRRDHRKQLWALLTFQLWHRRWLEAA